MKNFNYLNLFFFNKVFCMWEMIWPVLVVVLSNTFYNICTKSTPYNVNAFGTLMLTYITAAILTGIIFLFLVKPENAIFELSKVNWTSIVLGIAIVGLELGYIFMYRQAGKSVQVHLLQTSV